MKNLNHAELGILISRVFSDTERAILTYMASGQMGDSRWRVSGACKGLTMKNIGNPMLMVRLKRLHAPQAMLDWIDRRSLSAVFDDCRVVNYLLWLYKRMDKLLNVEDGKEFVTYYKAQRKVFLAEYAAAPSSDAAFDIMVKHIDDVRQWLHGKLKN